MDKYVFIKYYLIVLQCLFHLHLIDFSIGSRTASLNFFFYFKTVVQFTVFDFLFVIFIEN